MFQIQSLPRYTEPEDSLEQQEIQLLLEDVEAVELVSDSLFRLDASMVSNDHNYFVFEDLLHDVTRPRCRVTCRAARLLTAMVQVMLVFSRDEWVEQNAAASSQKQFALSTQVIAQSH